MSASLLKLSVQFKPYTDFAVHANVYKAAQGLGDDTLRLAAVCKMADAMRGMDDFKGVWVML